MLGVTLLLIFLSIICKFLVSYIKQLEQVIQMKVT